MAWDDQTGGVDLILGLVAAAYLFGRLAVLRSVRSWRKAQIEQDLQGRGLAMRQAWLLPDPRGTKYLVAVVERDGTNRAQTCFVLWSGQVSWLDPPGLEPSTRAAWRSAVVKWAVLAWLLGAAAAMVLLLIRDGILWAALGAGGLAILVAAYTGVALGQVPVVPRSTQARAPSDA